MLRELYLVREVDLARRVDFWEEFEVCVQRTLLGEGSGLGPEGSTSGRSSRFVFRELYLVREVDLGLKGRLLGGVRGLFSENFTW